MTSSIENIKIYEIFEELMRYVINTSPETTDHSKIGFLRYKVDEGRFFFLPETLEYLKRCDDACETYLVRIGSRPQGRNDDPGKVSKFAEEAAVLHADLRRLFADAPKEFEREMRIVLPPTL